jgi:glutamate/tyrosine decarboxylase-like PLP-dependent enzyme
MVEAASQFQKPLALALDGALKHLESLDTAPVCASTDPATLRSRLEKTLSDEGTPADRVIEDLLTDTAGGLIGSAGGRFFAWVIGGSLPAALAADWLTSAWDQNAAQFTASPAAAIVEDVAGNWHSGCSAWGAETS